MIDELENIKSLTLRQKAEEIINMKISSNHSETDLLKLIQELEVHQIELKMQNDELILAKQQEQLLKEKFTELYDFAPLGYVTLSKEGDIIELNIRAAKMLGKERSCFLNSRFGFFISEDTRSNFNLFFQNLFDSKAKETCEVKIETESNSQINIQIDGIVHQNDEKCLITMIDISERKQTEILVKKNEELIKEKEKSEIAEQITKQFLCKLTKAKEKAEESEQLKTAFLQNMSHEIRTPMNAIIGFSKMLDKPELSIEKRKSFTSIIVNSTNQLLSIVTDILTISSIDTKQEKVNITKVCINNIIVDLLSIFKPQAFNQNISLYSKQQLTDKQSEIFTDRTKVTQILSNLITNALKFTHEGFIEFGYNLKNDFLEFYVKDSGIGINIEMQDKIFERFRQANENINKKYGGTGLGLAISKAFSELLGGKIWVQSELEKGSTFYFTIPYKPVNEIDKSISISNQNGDKTTILIAEDEEYNFLLIEELLIDMDFELIHAKDGKETVEICHANPNINLILMDIKMPIMNGHIAAKQIKEFRPDLIIIAQSAYGLEQEIEKYSGIGFDDYVTKPINEDELKQKLTKYIAKFKPIC